jgi:protein TonB
MDVRRFTPLALVLGAHAAVLALIAAPSQLPRPQAPDVIEAVLLTPNPPAAPSAPAPKPPQAKPRPAVDKRPTPPRPQPKPSISPAPAPTHAAPSPAAEAPASKPAPAPAAPAAPRAAAAEQPVEAPRADAAHLNNAAPPYPSLSRKLNEQGRVVLRIYILADGKVGELSIKQSSGYTRLDQAALEAVRNWRFIPAKRGGEPIPYWYTQPISFSLNS